MRVGAAVRTTGYPLALFLAVGAPLFGLYFQDVLSLSQISFAALYAIGALGAIYYSATNNIRCGLAPSMGVWLIFYVFTLFNNNQAFVHGIGILYYSGLAMVAVEALILRGTDEGVGRCFLTAIVAFSLVHAAATILFCLIPPLCSAVRGSFGLSDGYGYTAGITNHYSTNGTLILTGLIASFAKACGDGSNKDVRVAIVLFLALALTSKRAHLAIGIVVCLLMYLLAHRDRLGGSLLKAFYGLIAGVAVFLLVSQFVPSLGLVVDRIIQAESDDSFGGRSGFYQVCFAMWDSSPVFGHGWNAFTYELAKTPLGMQLSSVGLDLMTAHNVYYQLLAEEGAVGLILFVAAGIFCGVRCLMGIFSSYGARSESARFRTIRLVLLASFGIQVYFYLYCMTGNPLYDTICLLPYLYSILSMEGALSALSTLSGEGQATKRGEH